MQSDLDYRYIQCAGRLLKLTHRSAGDLADLKGSYQPYQILRVGALGLGRIELRNADVYEVPLMIALLNILSVREPDPTAFSTSDIDFRIHGGHIYLTNIHFQGDAFRLSGSGLMEFDTSIRLTFRAMLGRREWELPLVREFFERVSEEILVIPSKV